MIRVTPTKVQYYYMRQSVYGFAMIRRWARLADVFVATKQNQTKWKKARRANDALVKAYREAAVLGQALEREALKSHSSL